MRNVNVFEEDGVYKMTIIEDERENSNRKLEVAEKILFEFNEIRKFFYNFGITEIATSRNLSITVEYDEEFSDAFYMTIEYPGFKSKKEFITLSGLISAIFEIR